MENMIFNKNLKPSFWIGVDEVGRGCLAGPVVVAAMAIKGTELSKIQSALCRIKCKNIRGNLCPNSCKLAIFKDSKKLTKAQREKWFVLLTNNKNIFWSVVKVGYQKIDRINISKAANLAANLAVKKLIEKIQKGVKTSNLNFKIFLDGGLYLLNKDFLDSRFQILNSIIKGDEKIPVIAMASIIAKVSRDKIMERLHKKYPLYGFNKHMSYGTKFHMNRLKKYGPSAIHRLSYKPVFNSLSFREKVYFIVSKIPKGTIMTYKKVAEAAGRPNAYRAVGNILNKSANGRTKIPCHRVIRSDGEFGGYNRGVETKRKILNKELKLTKFLISKF